jgi:hypothetical protein
MMSFVVRKGINMYYTCYKTHLYAMTTNVHKAIMGISRLGLLYLSTLHDSELSYKTDHTL